MVVVVALHHECGLWTMGEGLKVVRCGARIRDGEWRLGVGMESVCDARFSSKIQN